jgi:hypothetical protein
VEHYCNNPDTSFPYFLLVNSTALVIDPFARPENNVHMNKGDKRARISLLDLQSNDTMPSSTAFVGSIKLLYLKIPLNRTETHTRTCRVKKIQKATTNRMEPGSFGIRVQQQHHKVLEYSKQLNAPRFTKKFGC